VLLTSAVFSIAGKSRSLTRDSNTVHLLDEALRAATVVRAQIAYAALAQSSAASRDEPPAVSVAVRDVRQGLLDLDAAVAALASDASVVDARLRAAHGRFERGSRAALVRLRAGAGEVAAAIVDREVVGSFDVIRVALTRDRDEALAAVAETDSLLGRIGGLAAFVIAFVVPTFALLVYQQVTRRSRETVELTLALAAERDRWQWRRRLLQRTFAAIEGDLPSSGDGKAIERARRSLDDASMLVALLDSKAEYRFERCRLAPELELIAGGLRHERLSITLQDVGHEAWADRGALRRVLRSLIQATEGAGSENILIRTAADRDDVLVTIQGDGTPLAGEVVDALFNDASQVYRGWVEAGGAPVPLVCARELLEGMDGELHYHVDQGSPVFVARVPSAGLSRGWITRSGKKSVESVAT
jgi:hypothetical protein